ncbi:MAG: alpha-L-fucosidase, partial [Verrucomicrobiota bacterium]
MKKILLVLTLIALATELRANALKSASTNSAQSQAMTVAPATAAESAGETPAQRDARMAWWREAKFGLFIHWGVYSVPAGFYHDQPVKGIGEGIGEWIMFNGKIPMAEYQQFA